MKRLLAMWEVLPPETRTKILDNYPWLIVAGAILAAACYFGACKCRGEKKQPKPDATPAPVVASLFPGAAMRYAFLRAGDRDDPEYREALRKAEERWRERALRRTAAKTGQPCPDACGCGRCEDPCPCLATGRVCGAGCCCVVSTAGATRPMELWEKGGVEWDKVQDERRRVLLGTKEISRAEALRLVQGDVPDDGSKLRLTIIGNEADRKKVLAALDQPPLSELKGKCVVQAYDPSDWAVKGYGFVTGGTPTIYLQLPTGKVLHRQDTYTSAESLAAAIRKAEPTYDPKKDPDASKTPALPGMPDLSKIPVPVWIGGRWCCSCCSTGREVHRDDWRGIGIHHRGCGPVCRSENGLAADADAQPDASPGRPCRAVSAVAAAGRTDTHAASRGGPAVGGVLAVVDVGEGGVGSTGRSGLGIPGTGAVRIGRASAAEVSVRWRP